MTKILQRRVQLLGGLLASAICLFAGYVAYPMLHGSGVDHAMVRTRAIVSQLDQSSGENVLIVGDSITEFADVQLPCMSGQFNSGLGGANVSDALVLAKQIVAHAKVRTVILAVGVNDASFSARRRTDQFSASYRDLVDIFRAGGAKVYVSTVAPVSVDLPLGSKSYDAAFIVSENAAIREVARESDLPVVDFYAALADPTGHLDPGDTTDGVHLTPRGYTKWKRALAAAVCG